MATDIYKLRWERLQQMIGESLDEIGKAQEVDQSVYLKIKAVLLQVLTKWINKIEGEVSAQESRIVDSNYIFDTYDVKRSKVFYDRKVGKLPVFDGHDNKSFRYKQCEVEDWERREKIVRKFRKGCEE
jgi:hypothetical protein